MSALFGKTTVLAVAIVIALAGCPASDEKPSAGNRAPSEAAVAVKAAPSSITPPGASPLAAAPIAASLVIPQSHPRLWYSAEPGSAGAARLARAKDYYATHPITLPDPQDEPTAYHRSLALRSLVTGDPTGCQLAAAWLRDFTIAMPSDPVGGASDEARWYGEDAILVYDWCYAQLDEQARATVQARWNGYVGDLNERPYGGLEMPGNNYFAGYLRNGVLWSIASYHHNPEAPSLLAHALDERFVGAFVPWGSGFGRGGVTPEGGHYGPYILGYPVVAFTTVGDYGISPWTQTDFYRDAIGYLQHATVSLPTVRYDDSPALPEVFPFNDDQSFNEGGRIRDTEYANFAGAMILAEPDTELAAQAQAWLQRVGGTPSWWVAAELASAQPPLAQPLALDYYAAGTQFFYGRSNVQPGAATFHFQLGGMAANDGFNGSAETGGVGHNHLDAGTFQLWRQGRWLTRETTGYSLTPDGIRQWTPYLPGMPEPKPNRKQLIDPRNAIAHNAVLFEGQGQIDLLRGLPRTLRLQSHPAFAFAAVDLVDAYRAQVTQSWQARYDWPYAETAIREFVFIRDLETLIVLDRLESGSDSLHPWYATQQFKGPRIAAEEVRKTFVLHATGAGSGGAVSPYETDGNRASATVGGQKMDAVALLPSGVNYRVADEIGTFQQGDTRRVAQFRLEYDVSGSATSFLLNVVSLRDGDDVPVAASLVDQGDRWLVKLSHPVKGTVAVELRKGLVSQGGSVEIGGQTFALAEGVQSLRRR